MEAETRKIMARLNPNFRKFNVPVSALSGGQRQGVAVARAAAFGSKVVILDEPTAALDSRTGREVVDLLLKVSSIVSAYPQLSELDLNPVIAYPDGYAVVDARIITNRSIMSS